MERKNRRDNYKSILTVLEQLYQLILCYDLDSSFLRLFYLGRIRLSVAD